MLFPATVNHRVATENLAVYRQIAIFGRRSPSKLTSHYDFLIRDKVQVALSNYVLCSLIPYLSPIVTDKQIILLYDTSTLPNR